MNSVEMNSFECSATFPTMFSVAIAERLTRRTGEVMTEKDVETEIKETCEDNANEATTTKHRPGNDYWSK